MTKTDASSPEKTDVKVSLIGGHRLGGDATLHERTITASLIGGADVDLTDVDIPDGAELRITKLSLIGGVRLKVRADVVVEVHGIRLGGVKDDGPTREGGPTVRVDAWGLLGGVSVTRA
ncbi:cell wall-active antibiotics response protein [Actinacidiphila acidipaludis]|uniref:Cell wall-active antibiotics response protein n=1 Tax=Actinacidiphila acidipaludis TaxID=2873382 RepID=A0ABS7QFZ7_9ACTN|nr:cell wall-active antibiotics response protein [Streptomyces acidipaludis]MBY8880862.1 cell wall-active antibiotics response protein [Streptomyces acidipaludis]